MVEVDTMEVVVDPTVSGCCADGAGGGGSSYIGGVTDGSTTSGTGGENIAAGGNRGGHGSFELTQHQRSFNNSHQSDTDT